jgi:hypothetical protein
MSYKLFEIKRYQVYLGPSLYTSADAQSGKRFAALIMCFGASNESVDIFFPAEDSAPFSSTTSLDPPRGTIAAPKEQYAWYLDLLRNEAPVYAIIESDPQLNRLKCNEPVGGGELFEE